MSGDDKARHAIAIQREGHVALAVEALAFDGNADTISAFRRILTMLRCDFAPILSAVRARVQPRLGAAF